MRTWLFWALLCLVTWGFYGFFPKLATRHLTAQQVFPYYLFAGFVIGLVALLIFLIMGHKPVFHPKGALFASLAGMAGVSGGFFYIMAVSRGHLSVVVTLTALYPLITILLSLTLLQEPITLKQILGIGFALAAIVLLVT